MNVSQTPRPQTLYRVFFTSQGKSYELYARKVQTSELHGFVEIEEILFGEKSAIVVDPSEEQLRSEFGSVKRLHVPFHQISRIDEVVKEGRGKVYALGNDAPGNSAPLPVPPRTSPPAE